MNKRKIIIAIADGIGDRPISQLEGKTPLEYAETPNLDFLASEGINGIMDLISPGIPVGTDMGHMILFGYSKAAYPGRGPIEALGVGAEIQPGDIILRSNFATLVYEGEEKIIKDRRAGRIRERTQELALALQGIELNNGIRGFLIPATEHRAVLILRGENLSASITDSDPKENGGKLKKVYSIDNSMESMNTAAALNEYLEKCHEILENHPINIERKEMGLLPANYIITRGSGKMNEIEKISQKLMLKGACIAGEGTVLGIAKIAGFIPMSNELFTGNIDSDINLKAQMTLEASKENDIVYVHFKAPDLFGHDNKPLEKVKAIEKFDKLIGKILKDIDSDTYLAVAADHSTPCEVEEHSGDPVPIAIYGPSLRKDWINKFDEISCAHGGMGRLKGNEFIDYLHSLINKVKKEGA